MNKPTYFYDTTVRWGGQRRGTLGSPGLPELAISTPPEFKGQPGMWTPEHLFVASAEICLMATFIGIAELSKLVVYRYVSSARGRLEKLEGQGLQFAEIVISPIVEIESGQDIGLAERIMVKAEKGCLVANSMRTHVRVAAEISVRAAEAA